MITVIETKNIDGIVKAIENINSFILYSNSDEFDNNKAMFCESIVDGFKIVYSSEGHKMTCKIAMCMNDGRVIYSNDLYNYKYVFIDEFKQDGLDYRMFISLKNDKEIDEDGCYIMNSEDIVLTISIEKMKYSNYLKTFHWRQIRSTVKEYYDNKCMMCGEVEKEIHIHHNNYDCLFSENYCDVLPLCKDCHEKFHDIKEGG